MIFKTALLSLFLGAGMGLMFFTVNSSSTDLLLEKKKLSASEERTYFISNDSVLANHFAKQPRGGIRLINHIIFISGESHEQLSQYFSPNSAFMSSFRRNYGEELSRRISIDLNNNIIIRGRPYTQSETIWPINIIYRILKV